MTISKKTFTKEQLKDFLNYMRDDESEDNDEATKKNSKVEKKTFTKTELQDFIKNGKNDR